MALTLESLPDDALCYIVERLDGRALGRLAATGRSFGGRVWACAACAVTALDLVCLDWVPRLPRLRRTKRPVRLSSPEQLPYLAASKLELVDVSIGKGACDVAWLRAFLRLIAERGRGAYRLQSEVYGYFRPCFYYEDGLFAAEDSDGALGAFLNLAEEASFTLPVSGLDISYFSWRSWSKRAFELSHLDTIAARFPDIERMTINWLDTWMDAGEAADVINYARTVFPRIDILEERL